MMKKIISIIVCFIFFSMSTLLVGCGGTLNGVVAPEPLIKHQDSSLSCMSITAELNTLTDKKESLKRKIKGKIVSNTVMVICGIVVLFPFFLIDVSTDEELALASVDARITYLNNNRMSMGCVD